MKTIQQPYETPTLPGMPLRGSEARPRLMRPNRGLVGYVPEGAVDCTADELADAGLERLYRRLGVPDHQYLRVCIELNFFEWRLWGYFTGVNRAAAGHEGGAFHVRRPGAQMGMCWIVRQPLHEYRAWLWTLRDEVEEGVYLTRRTPRGRAAA